MIVSKNLLQPFSVVKWTTELNLYLSTSKITVQVLNYSTMSSSWTPANSSKKKSFRANVSQSSTDPPSWLSEVSRINTSTPAWIIATETQNESSPLETHRSKGNKLLFSLGTWLFFHFFFRFPLFVWACRSSMICCEVGARRRLRQILIQPLQQRFPPIDVLSLGCLICWITCLKSKKTALATEDN